MGVENVRELEFSSSMSGLKPAFDAAVTVSLSWVQDAKTSDVLPSYWAGLTDRPMFYSRDVAHQALAGHLLGLDEENFVMLRAFAASATAARRFYPLWAFLFDGTPAAIDYRGDEDFVRETPAPFEVAEKALEMFRWTGDRRYVEDPVFVEYYRHLVFDFIPLHDVQGLGLAGEHQAVDIFDGSPTYNEHVELPDLQIAADGVACQWAALRTIADVYAAEGTQPDLVERAARGAEETLARFEELWWDAEDRHYIVGLLATGRARGFASEASWFPMVKRMLPDGERVRSHLDRLAPRLRGSPPAFLESASYLPQAFFAYGYDEEALHWIGHLVDSGSNYPEVPFTIVSHLATGLTGLRAGDGGVVTESHVADGEWVEVNGIRYRSSTLSVRHEGAHRCELTVSAGPAVRWEAHFRDAPTQVVVVEPGATIRLDR
jgi:hypothetical protein